MPEHTILLVEDTADDVTLMLRSFKKAGVTARVSVVTDGEAAIHYLAGEGEYADRQAYPLPALVLLDLKLPKRTGFEVIEWVREQEGLRRVPIVVLTSSAESQDVQRAYDLGASSYLVKPVSADQMQAMAATLDLYWLQINHKPTLNH